jgi:hypothetical protein
MWLPVFSDSRSDKQECMLQDHAHYCLTFYIRIKLLPNTMSKYTHLQYNDNVLQAVESFLKN